MLDSGDLNIYLFFRLSKIEEYAYIISLKVLGFLPINKYCFLD